MKKLFLLFCVTVLTVIIGFLPFLSLAQTNPPTAGPTGGNDWPTSSAVNVIFTVFSVAKKGIIESANTYADFYAGLFDIFKKIPEAGKSIIQSGKNVIQSLFGKESEPAIPESPEPQPQAPPVFQPRMTEPEAVSPIPPPAPPVTPPVVQEQPKTTGLVVEGLSQKTIVQKTIERIISGITGAEVDIKVNQSYNKLLAQAYIQPSSRTLFGYFCFETD